MKREQTGLADIEGARLYYEKAGEGHYLVLAHAGIADRRMWDDQFHVLAQHYRVVRYDMRGFGNSEMTPGSFSHRQDLYNLLKFLGIEQAHLLGSSMGGATSIDFTLEHPEITTSLVLVAPALSGYRLRGEPPKIVLELIAARKAGDLHRAAELQVQIWVDGPRRTSDQVGAHVRERVRKMSFDALSNQAGSLMQTGFVMEKPLEPPAMERLSMIAVPTLVTIGDQDDVNVGMIADELVAGIAGAQKVIIHGTAHLPNMEQPEEFNRVVLAFIQSL